jgi:hypothetical protein
MFSELVGMRDFRKRKIADPKKLKRTKKEWDEAHRQKMSQLMATSNEIMGR